MEGEAKNKRIAFVIGNLQRDGAERVISILAEYYCQKGWAVDILTLLNDQCDYSIHPKIKLIPICRVNHSYYRNIVFWIRGIRKYLLAHNPDKLVSFVARINILTLIASLHLKTRIIVSERNDPAADGRSRFVRWATFLSYRLADCIIFQTKWAQSCFPENIVNKSAVILNPVQVSCLAAKAKKKKIVAVGRLEPQKNHSMLLEAFAEIKKKYPDYELHIYGDGCLKHSMKQRIRDLGLKDSVQLPGNVNNIHARMADAELFVLPSNYEGLSNALLEAMMMGLPCISTNCAGSNEIIHAGINGLIVTVGDTNELIEALKKVIENPELAASLGENAKQSSIAFASGSVLKQWESIIEK
ncbi:glycosyltransferase [Desulfosporosinus hippei]|uniref:Glycosyltransferase involved in cell wall bisynthesis n=1 Tax=Desulfosporosinus hippei DSM 8344 TaxID=1121419 RepID=A0A1G8H1A6_9FIRM|nr:glycosyltransferase [Desulfosporosinus hippei]SDI00386.1 Glycosyltransferase involved in cell wall bisynthesis [Desulfosporosinus hippei DSM 8344]